MTVLTHYPPRFFLTQIFVKIAISVHFRVLRNRARTVFDISLLKPLIGKNVLVDA